MKQTEKLHLPRRNDDPRGQKQKQEVPRSNQDPGNGGSTRNGEGYQDHEEKAQASRGSRAGQPNAEHPEKPGPDSK